MFPPRFHSLWKVVMAVNLRLMKTVIIRSSYMVIKNIYMCVTKNQKLAFFQTRVIGKTLTM